MPSATRPAASLVALAAALSLTACTGGTAQPPTTSGAPSGAGSTGGAPTSATASASSPSSGTTSTSDSTAALTFTRQIDRDPVTSARVAVHQPVRVDGGLLLTVDITPERDATAAALLCGTVSTTAACLYAVDTVRGRAYRTARLASQIPYQLAAGITYRLAAVVDTPTPAADTLSVGVGNLGVAPGLTVTDQDAPSGLPDAGVTRDEYYARRGDSHPGDVVTLRPVDATASTGGVEARWATSLDLVGPVSGGKTTVATGTVALPADVLFDFGKATLTPAAHAQLTRAAEILAKEADPTRPVTVTGNTDSVGGEAANKALSLARATSAVTALRALHPATYTPVGAGEGNPIAPNEVAGKDNPAGRALNRRVEITYTPKPVTVAPRPGTQSGPALPTEPTTTAATSTVTMGGGSPQRVEVRAYPVVRDGRFALVQLDLTPAGDVARSPELSASVNGDLLRVALVDPATGSVYGAAHSPTTAQQPRLDTTFPASTRGISYWGGRTYRVYAWTAAPPADVTQVTLRLGTAGDLRDVPVQAATAR